MYKNILIVCILILNSEVLYAQNEEGLVFVNLLYRHGDRTPVDPYPNDPYRDLKYWPTGWGQLTNKGKKQHLALGQWLRKRYSGFLPEKYSLNDVYVRSTDVDRTLMSAESNLAGLYPPIQNDIWDTDLEWQPIPVHTIPEKEDAILAAKRKCPRYDLELNKLLKSPEFTKIQEKLKPIYNYVSNYTGSQIYSLQELEYLYNTLYIESLYGLKLPNWTREVFPDKMRPWAHFSFRINCYTTHLQRLKMGLLVNDIFTRLISKSKGSLIPDRKMWIYSAHDTTVANILMSLGAFDDHSPPYTSLIIFELSVKNGVYYISTFYKNDTEPHPISILGCDLLCPLDRAMELLKPVILNIKQWDLECHSLSAPMVSTIAAIAVISCGVLLLLLLVSLCVSATFSKKEKHRNQFYQPLSDEGCSSSPIQNSEQDWLFKSNPSRTSYTK